MRHMAKVMRHLLAMLVWLVPFAAHTADFYLQNAPDIPLAPALHEITEEAVIFDKPAGRIIHARAKGAFLAGDIIDFYRTTLPNLGWKDKTDATHKLYFTRGNEALHIEIVDIYVTFDLTPHSSEARP